MSKFVKNVIVILGLSLTSYLLIAFAMWEINPGKWTEPTRVWAAFQTVVSVGIAVCITNSYA